MNTEKKILDACCGSRMFWFDPNNSNTVFMDIRQLETSLCDKRKLVISPDIVADFTNIPFEKETFYLVVFDPPHLVHAGKDSWMAKKYGTLNKSWRNEIKIGFGECFRVLKWNGVLIFKWNEDQIPVHEILKIIPETPLFGNRRAKTHWLVFMKI